MTDTPKYTQGPWRVGDAGHTVFGPKTEQPSPISIAHIAESNRTTREEKKANARLIAQAPVMAEILAVLVEHAKERYPHFESERGQREIAEAERILAAFTE